MFELNYPRKEGGNKFYQDYNSEIPIPYENLHLGHKTTRHINTGKNLYVWDHFM